MQQVTRKQLIDSAGSDAICIEEIIVDAETPYATSYTIDEVAQPSNWKFMVRREHAGDSVAIALFIDRGHAERFVLEITK